MEPNKQCQFCVPPWKRGYNGRTSGGRLGFTLSHKTDIVYWVPCWFMVPLFFYSFNYNYFTSFVFIDTQPTHLGVEGCCSTFGISNNIRYTMATSFIRPSGWSVGSLCTMSSVRNTIVCVRVRVVCVCVCVCVCVYVWLYQWEAVNIHHIWTTKQKQES